MAVIPVALAGRSYDVRIGEGLLADLPAQCGGLLRKRRVPIVTDANVAAHWRQTVETALTAGSHEAVWHVVEPGERAKSWSGLENLVEWLLGQEVERGDHILALGGGVVGDLPGFAASILKRGCGFIQLPTTLLAQVDSSVGGKTAINSASGKNLVGAFHQPSLVLADLATLHTLPEREMRAGYAEVLKYGVLGDPELFAWQESSGDRVLAGDRSALEEAVARSVAAKAGIVARDERETTGARALLNLGHTFGHALETETGFSDRLLHGEALALGMVLAARFSARRGLLRDEDAERVTRAVDRAGLPSEIAALGLEADGAQLAAHMRHDKKMDAGTLPFILLRGIGEAFVARDVEFDDVAAFLAEELQAH